MKKHNTPLKSLLFAILGIIIFYFLGNIFYKRFDLTQDKRFTLSDEAKNTIASVDSPLLVEVFLKGDFPPEFKKLEAETKQLLEEFEAFNPNITYEFINPSEQEGYTEGLLRFGIKPALVEVKENGRQSSQQIFPWAIASYKGKPVKINLLKNKLGVSSEERINNSVQNLEYAFADGFKKLVDPKSKKIAVLKGNGELPDKYVFDFFTTLKEYYYIAAFTLDSVSIAPKKTLEQIKEFDLIVIASPTEKFTESEKYVLDQYIMNGGASLWLVDGVELKKENSNSNSFAFGKDLGLTDFFFKYGLRINPNLIKDLYSAPILLASGQERESQYNRYPWFYSPLSTSNNKHPIVNNIDAVKFDYVSSIDLLPNSLKKTILLSTSPISKIVGVPKEIDISKEINNNLKIIDEGPPKNDFKAGKIPLAVLLEGTFPSAFSNRIKPFTINNDLSLGKPSKMVVISDGSVIKNQIKDNRPLELGFDKWTNSFYGNKEFLLNTVNYLLNDNGLISIRSKKISVPFLDPQKTAEQRRKWQLINILSPLVLLALFGFIFNYFRKKKYR